MSDGKTPNTDPPKHPHAAPDGTRQRYFFHGLTEEVTKQSVAGVASDTAFGMVERGTDAYHWIPPSGGSVAPVWDSAMRSNVLQFSYGVCQVANFTHSPGFSEPRRAVSFWVRDMISWCAPLVGLTVQTSAGPRHVEFVFMPGADRYLAGGYYQVFLGWTTGGWQRVERDLGEVIGRLTPGVTLTSVTGAYVRGIQLRMTPLRFCNSLTVEHNVLGPGEVGHILRSRTTTVAGGAYAPTDTWFAFNQVGSVVNHSNAAGSMTQAVDMDAWGNTLSATGGWAADQTGWKHSTKRLDPATGMTYGFARWSDVSVGTWLSRDPAVVTEGLDEYVYCGSNPVAYVDVDGLSHQPGGPYHPPDGVHTKCLDTDSCSRIRAKLWLVAKTIASHQGWECLSPEGRGQGRHAMEIVDLWRNYAKCQALYVSKGCSDPLPIPRWKKVLVKIPGSNEAWRNVGIISGIVAIGAAGVATAGTGSAGASWVPAIAAF